MNTKLFTLCLFVIAIVNVTAYDAQLAKKLAYFSGAAYSTESEINSWTCQYCSYAKLQSVILFHNHTDQSLQQSYLRCLWLHWLLC